MTGSGRTVEVDGREIELSNLDKTFFPGAGLTKGDVVDYYAEVSGVLLPHLEDRPLTMQRFPDGLEGDGFYQRDRPGHFPDWIESVTVEKEEGGEVECVLCQDRPTLIYLADQAALTLHGWLARKDRLRRPDRMVFDIDPPDEADGSGGVSDEASALVKEAARALRDVLEETGLEPFVMTTGSRGLHVTVPVERRQGFDEVRAFARSVADLVASRDPDRLTTAQRKARREGRLYLDCARNAYGQTGVAPYAVRARPGAPVAAPLEWDELGDGDLGPQSYTVENLFRRLGQKEDPWARIAEAARPLGGARERLEAKA